jgi:starvation-inducible outer membrane lipoprotein
MTTMRCLSVLALAALLSACATEPWVKPYERERLADPIMQVNRDALSARHTEHVREVREGGRGANGVQGGGCGCN